VPANRETAKRRDTGNKLPKPVREFFGFYKCIAAKNMAEISLVIGAIAVVGVVYKSINVPNASRT
jgi:hypothetical protein